MLRFLLVFTPMLLSAAEHPSRKRPSEQATQQLGAPEHKKRKVEGPTGQDLQAMLVDQQEVATGSVKPILTHAP